MPQVYRRYSEYVQQRPPPEPRRRSSFAPQPTDADDSIVLSDLVRTGEASRLRRRGAMRLDHALAGAPRPPLTPSVPPLLSTPSSATISAPPRPVVVVPSRTPTPPWAAPDPSGEDEFTYGGGEWRDWGMDDGPRAEGSAGGMQLDDMRRDSSQDDEGEFMLFCGGTDPDTAPEPPAYRPSASPFMPCALPMRPAPASAAAAPAAPRTNGCGALVHMRAFPQRPRGVWVGKEEASEVVVGLDASYFDRAVVAKMMKSACGCIREGIGCAMCGNTLGTRYLPCQAASEGFFYKGSSHARPSSPLHPSGPRYWDCRASAVPRASASGAAHARGPPKFYVYTFFADHVSPSRPYGFPAPPPPHAAEPALTPRAASPAPAAGPPPPTYYGYRVTASPRSYSPFPGQAPAATSSAAPMLMSSFAIPPLAATPRRGVEAEAEADVDSYAEDVRARVLDPDGVLVEVEVDVDVDMAEPSSPDKTGSEAVLWPGR